MHRTAVDHPAALAVIAQRVVGRGRDNGPTEEWLTEIIALGCFHLRRLRRDPRAHQRVDPFEEIAIGQAVAALCQRFQQEIRECAALFAAQAQFFGQLFGITSREDNMPAFG